MTARAQLDPVSADKLTKILGLLGSNHAGEREAAAQAADRLVRGLGLTWSEVIAPPPPVPDQWQPLRYWRAGNSDWCRMAQFCHAPPVAQSAPARFCRVGADLARTE
jgi:hypothetical protein